jgi:6-pyruvoyltetrahydropterin/6-carboxytetrahydropterin synthase
VPKRYVIRAQTEFSAAHVLHGYPGACDRVHGHNFKVVAEIAAGELDAVGMAVDFVALERVLAEIAAPFDHRLLNDVAPFTEVNPTAENIAAYFHQRLRAALGELTTGPVQLQAVTVCENDRTSVSVSDPEDG